MSNISYEEISSTRLSVKISASKQVWEDAEKVAVIKVGSKKMLPGFRQGKAPENLIKAKYLDEVNHNAALKVLENTAVDITTKTKAEIYRVLDIKVDGEREISLTFDCSPKVELCKLKQGELREPEPVIDDAALQEELKALQKRFAKPSEKDANDVTIKNGDLIEADYEFWVNDLPEGQPVKKSVFVLGEAELPKEVQDGIIAKQPKINEEFKIEFELPSAPHHHHDGEECHHDHGPQKVLWVATISSVKTLILPELSDDFAKQVNPKLNTLEDLKKQTIESLSSVIRRDLIEKQMSELVDIYVQNSDIRISESYLQDECMRFLEKKQIPKNNLSEDDIKYLENVVRKDIEKELIYSELINQSKEELKTSVYEDMIRVVKEKNGQETADYMASILSKVEKGQNINQSETMFVNYFRNDYFFNLLFDFLKKKGIVKKGATTTVAEYKEFLKKRSQEQHQHR